MEEVIVFWSIFPSTQMFKYSIFRQSYELNAPDAEFNVVYLGNVRFMEIFIFLEKNRYINRNFQACFYWEDLET